MDTTQCWILLLTIVTIIHHFEGIMHNDCFDVKACCQVLDVDETESHSRATGGLLYTTQCWILLLTIITIIPYFEGIMPVIDVKACCPV